MIPTSSQQTKLVEQAIQQNENVLWLVEQKPNWEKFFRDWRRGMWYPEKPALVGKLFTCSISEGIGGFVMEDIEKAVCDMLEQTEAGGHIESESQTALCEELYDAFWAFQTTLCPLSPCPFNHRREDSGAFLRILREEQCGEPEIFMNYDWWTYSSLASAGYRQDMAPTSSLNKLDGELPFGETLDTRSDESLNRLNWTLMNMVWSPFQDYPRVSKQLTAKSARDLKKRILFKPHSAFSPKKVVQEIHRLRECCRASLRKYPLADSYWRATSLVLEEVDCKELDDELFDFLVSTMPKDRLLAGCWAYFGDLNAGSWAHGLDLGRSYRNTQCRRSSLVHMLADNYSWFSIDVAVNELLHATHSCTTPQAFHPVGNGVYCALLCKLKKSIGLSAGIQSALYKLYFQNGSAGLAEALGDCLELVGGLAVMRGRSRLFSLLVQASLYLVVVEQYDNLWEPSDLPDPFQSKAHGREVPMNSPAISGSPEAVAWASGLDKCRMPIGWQRAYKLVPSSAGTQIRWVDLGHPDPYVTYFMKNNSLFRSLAKYWNLEKDTPHENRNFRGKRQAGLASRLYLAVNEFLESMACKGIVTRFLPLCNATLQLNRNESRAAKEMKVKYSQRSSQYRSPDGEDELEK